jgi:uncharacterized membrane protein YvlD (DUF360 family)
VRTSIRLLVRGLLTWAIEAAALFLLLGIVPGLELASWSAAALAILAIGLLNALVRPAILLLAASLGVVPFLLVALPLNVLVVLAAGWLVPGFILNDSILTAFLVAFGLAVLNAILSAMLSVNDDDSFYRNVVRRLARRSEVPGGMETPGLVIVQIDGLPEAVLRRAITQGKMPTLASWLRSGSHRLVGWECDLPCMTTSAQAAILHGDNCDIPAFFWFEKRDRQVMSSASPYDMSRVQRRLAGSGGLLRDDGVSVTNLFSGGAERPIMTVGTLIDEHGALGATPRDFLAYLLNPYNLYRGLAGMVGEALLELWQGVRQWARDVRPRGHRLGIFALQRGAANVVLRDATTWAVVGAMYAGRRVIYCDYLGYDEVAHFAGPETQDALDTLIGIDRQLRQLAYAAREAPRPYHFVVLSDHGQSTAYLFEREYGKTLGELVGDLLRSDRTVQMSSRSGESTRHLRSLIRRVTDRPGRAAGGARSLARLPDEANIYFATQPDRLTFEQIAAAYPELIPALVGHPGLEHVIVLSETRGPLVIGKRGIRELDSGRVEGDADPLADFSLTTPEFLRRLARFNNAGDIVVNGAVDRGTGAVMGFDSLVGAHGGVGGLQVWQFVIYPSDWTDDDPVLVGSLAVHRLLRRFIGRTAPRDGDPSDVAELAADNPATPTASPPDGRRNERCPSVHPPSQIHVSGRGGRPVYRSRDPGRSDAVGTIIGPARPEY